MFTSLLWFPLLSAPASASVVDRVVLIVEEELVLASDIRLEAVLAGLDVSPLPFWRRSHGTPEERLQDAAVVRSLAQGVSLFEPDESEVASRVEKLRTRFGGQASWDSFLSLWGLDEGAVMRLMRRRLIVERYLARNIAESPADEARWLRACHDLLDEVRGRFSIRVVPQRGAP